MAPKKINDTNERCRGCLRLTKPLGIGAFRWCPICEGDEVVPPRGQIAPYKPKAHNIWDEPTDPIGIKAPCSQHNLSPCQLCDDGIDWAEVFADMPPDPGDTGTFTKKQYPKPASACIHPKTVRQVLPHTASLKVCLDCGTTLDAEHEAAWDRVAVYQDNLKTLKLQTQNEDADDEYGEHCNKCCETPYDTCHCSRRDDSDAAYDRENER